MFNLVDQLLSSVADAIIAVAKWRDEFEGTVLSLKKPYKISRSWPV